MFFVNDNAEELNKKVFLLLWELNILKIMKIDP